MESHAFWDLQRSQHLPESDAAHLWGPAKAVAPSLFERHCYFFLHSDATSGAAGRGAWEVAEGGAQSEIEQVPILPARGALARARDFGPGGGHRPQ